MTKDALLRGIFCLFIFMLLFSDFGGGFDPSQIPDSGGWPQ